LFKALHSSRMGRSLNSTKGTHFHVKNWAETFLSLSLPLSPSLSPSLSLSLSPSLSLSLSLSFSLSLQPLLSPPPFQPISYCYNSTAYLQEHAQAPTEPCRDIDS